MRRFRRIVAPRTIKLQAIRHGLFTARCDIGTVNAILLIVSVVLPLLPVVMFPTRFIGRGTGATVVGAVLIVGMMMVIYFSLSAATGDQGAGAAAPTDLPSVSDADLSALKDLLN